MIEKIGLTGLLFLWLNAVAVAFVVPMICGIVLVRSLWIGILFGTLAAAAVGSRAVYRIRGSLRQWKIRHGRLPPEEVSSADGPPRS